MNERIRKIAQQAGLAYAEDVGCGFPDIKYPAGTEKFAQLLIQEILAASNSNADLLEHNWADAAYGIRSNNASIREMFGVA